MKKTLSVLLAGAMAAGTLPLASASSTTLKDFMSANGIPSQYNVDVDADIEVKSSSDTAYVDGPITLKTKETALPTFDYKATLFMQAVRDAFTTYTTKAEGAINRLADDADKAGLLTELDNLPVTGEFTVTIKNADEMIIPEYIKEANILKGFNDATKNIFEETGRTYDDSLNTMTITIKVKGIDDSVASTADKGYVTKAQLAAGLDTYLADLELSCDGVEIDGFGTYELIGEITGYTNIGDDPATAEDETIAKITYNAVQEGDASAAINAIVSVSETSDNPTRPGSSTGGSSSTSSITVTIEVDDVVIHKETSSTNITYNPYDLDVPEKENHLFAGWYNKSTDELITGPVNYSKNTTIIAKWIPTGNINIDFVVNGVKADVNSRKENSVNTPESAISVGEEGTEIKVSDISVVVPNGMKFDGWFLDAEYTIPADDTMTLTEDTTLYGKTSKLDGSDIFDTENHYAYIIGYPDGYVRPTQNISREEVVTIFFRLLTDEARADLLTKTNDFVDVDSTRWSNNAISTMENYGLITGYADGTFKPAADITRAEFVTMAARFYDVEEGTSTFADAQGHWAEKYIASATAKGWITGYSDGTFKPDQYITRAEAMTIVNNMLGRQVNAEGLHEDAVQWTDNTEDAWYYYEVLEATNSHKYEDRAEGVLDETWTECVENYDWSTLEK